MDELKNQRYQGKSLIGGIKEPKIIVTETKVSVENALRRTQPSISVSDNIGKWSSVNLTRFGKAGKHK